VYRYRLRYNRPFAWAYDVFSLCDMLLLQTLAGTITMVKQYKRAIKVYDGGGILKLL
jgi:hypothetical protein